MAGEEYSETLLAEEDLPRIKELYSAAFLRAPEVEVLRWKYFRNPCGEAIWVGVTHHDRIVAAGAMIPELFSVFGDARSVYKCTDLMVHPEHQRRGLATRVIGRLKSEIRREDPVLTYTLCAKHATAGFARNGYEHKGELRNYFKPAAQIKAEALLQRLRPRRAGERIRLLADGLPELEKLTLAQDPNRVEAIRSPDYLRWRITNPRYEYSVFGAFRGDALLGYCMCGEARYKMINIIDAEVLDRDARIYGHLLHAVQDHARKTGSRALTAATHTGTHFYDRMVARRGFVRNSFRRGPLHSQVDLNVCIEEARDHRALNGRSWEIYAMNYDDS